jgi:DNA invertase Pin-like site-specific DNA recombinase
MKRCIAYCRVSTSNEDQKNSLEAQKKYYTDLFQKEGYNPAKVGLLYKKNGETIKVTGIFADEGISGTSLKRRKAFNSMIEYAKKKAFDIIYVKSVSRFARSVEDGTKTLKDLKELGVAVIFEDCNLNSLDSKSEFEINLRMMLAQEESRNKSDSVKWGIRRLQENGGWNAGAPYGYDIVDKCLVINEHEAEIVKKMYDLFLNGGYGIGKIARYLNDNDIPTKKGSKWSQTQVTRIMENEIYKGVQRSHTVETIDINRHLRTEVDEYEQIVHEKEGLLIIDRDMFEQVQAERLKRGEMFSQGTHHSNTHLLSNIIYCGHCGGYFKRKKRHTYKRIDGTSKDIGYEWTCAINDMYGKSRCGHRNMLAEDDFINDVKAEITKLKSYDLRAYFDLYLLVTFDYEPNETELQRLTAKRDKVNRLIKINAEDYADDVIDKEQYRANLKGYNNELNGIEAEIRRLEQYDLDIENAQSKYEHYLKYIQEVDVEQLNNATLKKIFSKIVVKDMAYSDSTRAKVISYQYSFMGMSFDDLITVAKDKGLSLETIMPYLSDYNFNNSINIFNQLSDIERESGNRFSAFETYLNLQ